MYDFTTVFQQQSDLNPIRWNFFVRAKSKSPMEKWPRQKCSYLQPNCYTQQTHYSVKWSCKTRLDKKSCSYVDNFLIIKNS